MRFAAVLIGLTLTAGSTEVRGQENNPDTAIPWGREDRVVVYSPHFDVPMPSWGGLNCPAGPVHLYGFENTERSESGSSLNFRSFLWIGWHWGTGGLTPAGGAVPRKVPASPIVRLTHRISGGVEEELPEERPWTGRPQEAGLVVFEVPPGMYRVRIVDLGIEQDGIIQVRRERADSLHALLLPGAICN